MRKIDYSLVFVVFMSLGFQSQALPENYRLLNSNSYSFSPVYNYPFASRYGFSAGGSYGSGYGNYGLGYGLSYKDGYGYPYSTKGSSYYPPYPSTNAFGAVGPYGGGFYGGAPMPSGGNNPYGMTQSPQAAKNAINLNYQLGLGFGGMPLPQKEPPSSANAINKRNLKLTQKLESDWTQKLNEKQRADYKTIEKKLSDFRSLDSSKTYSLNGIALNDDAYKDLKEGFRATAPLERLRRHLLDYQTAFSKAEDIDRIQVTLEQIEALQKMLLFENFMLKNSGDDYRARNNFSDTYKSIEALLADVYLNSKHILLLRPVTNERKYSALTESFYNWSNEIGAPNGALVGSGGMKRALTPKGVKDYYNRPEVQAETYRSNIESRLSSKYFSKYQINILRSLRDQKNTLGDQRLLPAPQKKESLLSH